MKGKQMPRARTSSVAVREGNKVDFYAKNKLNPQELALVERYKKDNNITTVVQNSLQEIIYSDIDNIKEMIDNLTKYGDPHVFSVVPKELDQKLRDYGMAVQEFFGKKSVQLKGQAVNIIPVNYHYCNRCGKYKAQTEFFLSYSDSSNGFVPLCKDCCDKLFKQYLQLYGCKEALIVLCQKLDVQVCEPILSKYVRRYSTATGKTEIADGTFVGLFMSENTGFLRMNNVEPKDCCFCKTNLHGEPFRRIEAAQPLQQIYNDATTSQEEEEYYSITGTTKPLRELKAKWGKFPKDDLYWLEDHFQEYYDRCEIEGLSREKLVMQLCCEELDLVRTREKGGATKDKLRNFQALMKEADLTPRRQTMVANESQFQSLGTLIKTAEVRGPLVTKNKRFTDVDDFQRLWQSMAGALIRTLGKDAPLVKTFEENYKDFTADLTDTGEVGEQDETDKEQV